MIAKPETCARDAAQQRAAAIAMLNDALRRDLTGGRLLITCGVIALGKDAVPQILAAVRGFTAFTSDNDPYGEHDLGSVTWNGEQLFWKIDYYDSDCRYGSPDPADPSVTTRVLTIMLAAEY